MKNFLNKFKIPTLFGLGIIALGIGVGIFLVLREQTFLSSAAPTQTPQNITVSNVEDSSVVISWQTSSPSSGFITFGQNDPSEQTTLDDRDVKIPQSHQIHYVTIKNLLPKTGYKYKVVSGKITSEVSNFKTADPVDNQTGFRPVIGSVLEGKQPLVEGVAFLSISRSVVQTSLIKNLGNFLIPLAKIRKEDLSDILPIDQQMLAKITIISPNNQGSAVFNLQPNGVSLPPLNLGESIDLTNIQPTPQPTQSSQDLTLYDLNSDGKINAADYSLALKNKGKKINSVKTASNSNRVINQTYLNELTKMINAQNPNQ